MVPHNGAFERNTNRLGRPANDGKREPRSDARLTAHTFLESPRLQVLYVSRFEMANKSHRTFGRPMISSCMTHMTAALALRRCPGRVTTAL